MMIPTVTSKFIKDRIEFLALRDSDILFVLVCFLVDQGLFGRLVAESAFAVCMPSLFPSNIFCTLKK